MQIHIYLLCVNLIITPSILSPDNNSIFLHIMISQLTKQQFTVTKAT